MSSISRHHQELDDLGIGKCSVPMWCEGCPVFCDDEAYGNRPPSEQFYSHAHQRMVRADGRYDGYVPALACPCHGGPSVRTFKDGDAWCAVVGRGFTNIQECKAGFGNTKEEAMRALGVSPMTTPTPPAQDGERDRLVCHRCGGNLAGDSLDVCELCACKIELESKSAELAALRAQVKRFDELILLVREYLVRSIPMPLIEPDYSLARQLNDIVGRGVFGGTSNCPICGIDTSHEHSGLDVGRYREGGQKAFKEYLRRTAPPQPVAEETKP